jgi:hypothetical protein
LCCAPIHPRDLLGSLRYENARLLAALYLGDQRRYQLEALISYLPALACGAMMLLICIPMMRNMHKGHGDSGATDTRQEVAELREEMARLKAERALEDNREALDG